MKPKAARVNEQIYSEASEWFVAFRTDDPGAAAREEFRDWLRQSPDHIQAYLELAALYADLPEPTDRRSADELIALAVTAPDSNVVPLRERTAGSTSAHGPNAPRNPPRRALAAAAVVLLTLSAAWLFFEHDTYRTGVGEQRSITLADGSLIELNVESRVHVAYSAKQRDVQLLAGQALFKVAKDPSRSFVVHVGDSSVRAVGTQFDVYRRSSGITVTVIEGRVAVLNAEPASGAATAASAQNPSSAELVGAGEQVTLSPSQVQKVARPDILAATAWTQHQLIFDATPLAQVLEEFARYSPRRVVVDSPALAQLQISGQYTSSSPDSLLRFLSLQKGVVIVENNGATHIRQE